MSARRRTPIEKAIIEERERCIDELLTLASDALPFDLEYARGYYRSAWMLATSIDRDGAWPSPSEWIGYVRDAMEHAS
jgi:hypothetical protein